MTVFSRVPLLREKGSSEGRDWVFVWSSISGSLLVCIYVQAFVTASVWSACRRPACSSLCLSTAICCLPSNLVCWIPCLLHLKLLKVLSNSRSPMTQLLSCLRLHTCEHFFPQNKGPLARLFNCFSLQETCEIYTHSPVCYYLNWQLTWEMGLWEHLWGLYWLA